MSITFNNKKYTWIICDEQRIGFSYNLDWIAQAEATVCRSNRGHEACFRNNNKANIYQVLHDS